MLILMNRPEFEDVLAANCLDGYLATTAESVTYLSGYWAMPQWIRKGPQAYAFQPSNGRTESFVVTSTGLLDQAADQDLYVNRIHRYGFFSYDGLEQAATPVEKRLQKMMKEPEHASSLDALAHAFVSAGIRSGRIAIEHDGLADGIIQKLKERFPRIEWVKGDHLSRTLRAIKTAEEIDRLRSAARIAERSIRASLDGATIGEAEADMASRFHQRTVLDGATPVSPPCFLNARGRWG